VKEQQARMELAVLQEQEKSAAELRAKVTLRINTMTIDPRLRLVPLPPPRPLILPLLTPLSCPLVCTAGKRRYLARTFGPSTRVSIGK